MKKMIMIGLIASTALTSTPVKSNQEVVKLALDGVGWVGSLAYLMQNDLGTHNLPILGPAYAGEIGLLDLAFNSKSLLIKGASKAILGYPALAVLAKKLTETADLLGYDKTGFFLHRALLVLASSIALASAVSGTLDIINGIAEKFESQPKQEDPIIQSTNARKSEYFEALEKGDLPRVEKYLKKRPATDNIDILVFDDSFAAWHGRFDVPLNIAARNGHYDCVVALLQAGAAVNATDFRSASPLHEAVYSGNMAIVQLLLEKGADIDKRDANGHTPYDFAILHGYTDIAQILAEHENYKK